jgi:hypothetical protein
MRTLLAISALFAWACSGAGCGSQASDVEVEPVSHDGWDGNETGSTAPWSTTTSSGSFTTTTSAPTTTPTGTTPPTSTTPTGSTGTDPLIGWIGSPCVTAADCPYDDAVCVTDGFTDGMCTLPCDLYCPDEPGFPMTFCATEDELLPEAAALGEGACVSRCDFGAYAKTGCRSGYGCTVTSRANEDWTQAYTCLPGPSTELDACYLELAARGVSFEPTLRADDHPVDAPELSCHIDNPVYLHSPVHGVDLRYFYSEDPAQVLVDCETAHAIVDTVQDLIPQGVVEIEHVGTYSCRTIAGTGSLSQHALGRAIDLYGFWFEDGGYASVYDHWEHEDPSPDYWEGAFLYDATRRWYDDWVWNIILTPEYNDVHDNHFHVDLTEDAHVLHFMPYRYLGPAPYRD